MTVTWHARAACVGYPDHIFFPEHGTRADTARAICAACPVRIDCLRFALDVEQGVDGLRGRHGIWGGLTATERTRLATRKRARA